MAAAAAAAGATAPPALASTYIAKYSNEPDVLNGEYSTLYSRYNSGIATSNTLKDLAINSSRIIPKVYLYLTLVNKRPVIAAFHRPSIYEAHPIEVSEWDGTFFIFRGDVMPGNHIPMVQFPDEVFDRTEMQRVPTVAAMDGLVATLWRLENSRIDDISRNTSPLGL